MPRVTQEVPHTLGQEEAMRRVKEKIAEMEQTHRNEYSGLNQQWDGPRLSFEFRVVGMKISGTADVEESQVQLTATVPFAAMMFKGKIERGVSDELGALLA